MSLFIDSILSDAKRIKDRPTLLWILKAAIFNSSFSAAFFIRCCQYSNLAYPLFRLVLNRFFCIDFTKGATIGKAILLPHPFSIVIGKGAVIRNNVTIYQGVTIGSKRGAYPVLDDGVIVFPNAVIVGNITVAKNIKIKALSFVDEDVFERY